jgi:peptidoglycan/xylan/chitin deacetylase (PgdA/CDA1 family)
MVLMRPADATSVQPRARVGAVASPVRRLVRGARRRIPVLGSVVRISTVEPLVVVTFDDGPQPGGTDEVLAALAAHGASATFFVLLGRVRRYPRLLAEVVSAGHEVALHGPDHRSLTSFGYRDVLQRTRDARAELEDRAGGQVRWIRPPYGRQTLGSWHAVRRAGLTPVMWSATTWDSRDVGDDQRLAMAARASGGSILLAHDGFAAQQDGVDDGPEPAIARGDLIDRVLTGFRSRGLRACSLAAALRQGTAARAIWFGR